MTHLRTKLTLITAAVFLFLGTSAVQAGFGITPPYVKNDSLTRSSEYEQRIILVRGDPNDDLRAQITVDVPGINEWFSVDKGLDFILPKGSQKVPIIVHVKVPRDAEYKRYKGNIRVRTSPVEEATSGGVSIALGAQIDVDINVIDRQIVDFRVRKIEISDLNEGHVLWWLYYPGKIRFGMNIENIGNVSSAPSRVSFNIYDPTGENLLEQTDNTNSLPKVKPFEVKEMTAELPTHLDAGSYLARYRIYRDDEIKQEGEVNVSILPYGQIADDLGYGFIGLSFKDKATIVGPLSVFMIFVGFGVWQLRTRRKARFKI